MTRVCVVGAGRWGKNHVRTLHELGVLAALVDESQERLGLFAEQYPGLETHGDIESALAHNYDAYTVATPAETHFSIAKQILESGAPVLVEKPLALSSEEARSLNKIARDNRQQLMVGHLMLFHPAIVKIKELVDSGKIGSLQYIYSNRTNLGTVRTEEDVLWSFAPHDVSIFQYLLDSKPLSVESRGGAYLQTGVHDSVMTTLTYPGNISCHNFVSWLHPFKEHRLVVIGSEGMLTFEDSANGKPLRLHGSTIEWNEGEPAKREGPIEDVVYDDKSPLTEELRYFIENSKGTIARADARNAIEVLEILELASASLMGMDSPQPESGIDSRAMLGPGSFVHRSSYVDAGARIGAGTKIWHFSHVQQNAELGERCSLGQNVNIGSNVRIGNGVRIQNNVSVFEGVEIEDDVFCGPSMTFTNVMNPRAAFPTGAEGYGRTLVMEGATIGAKAVIVCGHTVGKYAFIAAGAVITSDVKDFAFMVGVPAAQIGWAMHGGERIPLDFRGKATCSRTGHEYVVTDGGFSVLS